MAVTTTGVARATPRRRSANSPEKTEAIPVEVVAKLFRDSLIITWTTDARDGAYQVKVQYYDPNGPMLKTKPEQEKEQTCIDGAEVRIEHPSPFPGKTSSCSVAVTVSAGECEGKCYLTWDGCFESATCGFGEHLAQHSRMLTEACKLFHAKRRSKTIKIMTIGPQHAGKSSLTNHIGRQLSGNISGPNEMQVSPSGHDECTRIIKNLPLPFQDYEFLITDTLAVSTLSNEQGNVCAAMLAAPLQEGMRRGDIQSLKWWLQSWFGNPHHAAIVVVSLTAWQAEKSAVESYLKALADKLMNSSDGKIPFPYVVVATKRDEFLAQCQDLCAHEALKDAVKGIQRSSLTESVYTVASYKNTSHGSPETNEETFKLLRDVVTLAKNQDTAAAKQGMLCAVSFVFFVLFVCTKVSQWLFAM